MSTPLTVRLGPPTGREISPDLWGLFFEDINDSLDGGLNADLVRNGHFEFTEADHEGWGPLTAWATAGDARTSTDSPVHENNAVFLRLDASASPASATNEGYGPMVLAPGTYELELATRAGGPAALTAELIDDEAAVAAAEVVVEPGAGWRFGTVRLEVGAHVAAAGLRLSAAAGVVDLDVVSLRPVDPATGRARTFRPDLVEVLAELEPSFLRFPGGCVAHGIGLENIYHWKPTVGPRHERHQMRNVWGYHQSMSIGYLEYFELCELLGASPLPVLAAGVCCQNTRGGPQAIPQEEMAAYVQDVLDLVEFANGGTDTVWGARRAELGHPEPFGLRYLGIGNEDEITPEFADRFAQILRVVRDAHPDVVVVGTSGPAPFGKDFDEGWRVARELGVDVVDEHGYRSPHWWLQHLDRYDEQDRSGPGVYFGEYGSWSSRLRSALSEAAFMIGMERNGDIVRLASYAPLLARVGHTQWVPDLVYFTETEVRRTASFHVQRMFSAVRGSEVAQVEVDGAVEVVRTLPDDGDVRLRSRGADVDWSDVTVNGATVTRLSTAQDGEPASVGRWDGRRVEVSATMVRRDGALGADLELGGQERASHYTVTLGGWNNRHTTVGRRDDGIGNGIDDSKPFAGVQTGVPLAVRVLVEREDAGSRVRVWLDGALVHDVLDADVPEQRVAVGALATTADAYVVRLVNSTEDARDLELRTPWSGEVRGSGEVLAGPDPDEGEAFERWVHEPEPLALTGSAGVLRTTLPPWSFAVVSVARES